jgi:hypothetical protein
MRESRQGVFNRPEASCATADKESEQRQVRQSHSLQRPATQARAKKRNQQNQEPQSNRSKRVTLDVTGRCDKRRFARGEAMASDDPL